MRRKEIDTALDEPLIDFGVFPDGRITVATPEHMSFLVGVDRENAFRVIAHTGRMVQVIYALNDRHPDSVYDAIAQLENIQSWSERVEMKALSWEGSFHRDTVGNALCTSPGGMYMVDGDFIEGPMDSRRYSAGWLSRLRAWWARLRGKSL